GGPESERFTRRLRRGCTKVTTEDNSRLAEGHFRRDTGSAGKLRPRAPSTSPDRSELRRHLEAFAVLARQHRVGFLVADELLVGRVDLELATQLVVLPGQLDLVVLEVLAHAPEGRLRLLVAAQRLGVLVEGLVSAQAQADVTQVAQRAGQVAFRHLGIE